jgi:ribosomal protein S18 acetylase RimI-like enzyme
MNGIFDISYAEVEIIKDLWEKNRRYHEKKSEYFKESYRSIRFAERIKVFSGYSEETMKISVVKNKGEYIGYCISVIADGKGELETLHIDETSRGNGIGKRLVSRHIEWMNEKKCEVIGVTVSQENEPTIGFYKKLGFYPNTLYMQKK